MSAFQAGVMVGLLIATVPAIVVVVWFVIDCRNLETFGKSVGKELRDSTPSRGSQ